MIDNNLIIEFHLAILREIINICKKNIIVDKYTVLEAGDRLKQQIRFIYDKIYPLDYKDYKNNYEDVKSQKTLDAHNQRYYQIIEFNNNIFKKKLNEVIENEENEINENENKVIKKEFNLEEIKIIEKEIEINIINNNNIIIEKIDNNITNNNEYIEIENSENQIKAKKVFLYKINNENIKNKLWEDFNENEKIQKIIIVKDNNMNCWWIYLKLKNVGKMILKEYKDFEYTEEIVANKSKEIFIKRKGKIENIWISK